MARRKRNRKGQFMKAGGAKRRRRRVLRRNPGRFALANPPKRRRRRLRRHLTQVRRHKRHVYRRNPGNVVNAVMQGLKDGTAVVAGQVAVRKIRGAVTGMLPATVQAQVTAGVGSIGLSVASAVAVSVVARKFAPNYARVIAAGAFSEAINSVLATTPIAPFLSAWPRAKRLAAYPGTGSRVLQPGSVAASGMAAYPRVVGLPMSVGL